MTDTSLILGLPYIQPSQAQKHVTHNEALRVLDALVQLSVLARDLTLPPAGAAAGDRYLVASPGQAEWVGQSDAIAIYDGLNWTFLAPQAGWQAYVVGEGTTVVFDGTDWQGRDLDTVDSLGVNASADAFNRLSVSSDAVLLNHAGSDHQLKINKADTADTASLMFQNGFSGRAEMGLAGNDDFSIKVSDDGATWNEAMRVDAASGVVSTLRQPYFVARGSGPWLTIDTPHTDLVLGVMIAQNGGVYDPTTGTFTAPTDGLYCFLINGFLNASTDGRIAFSLNGTTQSAQMQVLLGEMPLSFTAVMELSTGDTVTCRTGNANDNLTFFQSHTTFSGWKIF
ncbi:DUF2793 domain-containing protein [uncultured Tateyamaria sp.]|uniref:DUF2793 domain-containing protein n=1 Tax=uncultured Tateyamaria sp. TaxID=455651 RepID=UPI00261C00EF|nr:DUF2793 domain-containing protein [uncultured Tateyamaria sp.]